MQPALHRLPFWPRHLHHQLVLMVVVSLLLALGVLGGYTASEQSRIARRAVEDQARSLARTIAVSSRNALLTDSLDQLEELVIRSADFKAVRGLQVLSPQGRNLSHVTHLDGEAPQLIFDPPTRLAALPHQPVPQLAPLATDADADADDIVTAWHPITAGQLLGWVRVDYDASALRELRHSIWRNTLVVAIAMASLFGTLMAWLLRRPLRALDRARRFAVEMTNAEGKQMPHQPGPVEVEELDTALNEASMLLRQQVLLIEDWLRQHRANEARLSEQNEQLSALFTHSRDGLVTIHREGRVLFANQAFLRLTGLRAAQIVGRSEVELEAALRQAAEPGSTFTSLQACCTRDAEGQPAVQTLMLHGPQGRTVLTLSGQNSDSETVSRVLYVCDVTKQHTLDQMKSEFLSMAAHELRTPMVSIFGFTELMLHRTMPPEQQRDLLGRIHRQGQSMVAILNELLDLARIEARRGQDFKFETVDLADMVRAVVTDFKTPPGREPPVLDWPDRAMPVHVDPHKLQQAVLNVLSNAYKYSPQGGPVRVRGLCLEGETLRHRYGIEIEDHGMGLSPDNLARLGERFFRVDKSGSIPGTGLGVSIVKELMELMGGRLQVASSLGEGTTVTLWLGDAPAPLASPGPLAAPPLPAEVH